MATDSLSQSVESHARQGRWADARRACERILLLYPERIDIAENLAISLAGAGLPGEAAALLGNVVASRPDDPALLGNLGVVLTQDSRFSEAIEMFLAALRVLPGSALIHYNLGNAFAGAGSDAQAIESYREAIRLDPVNAAFRNNLGMAYFRTGEYEQAADSFREAVRCDPEFSDANANLGRVLVAAGRLQESITAFKRALFQKPDNAIALRFLPLALLDTGEWPEAFAFYEHALQHGATSADICNEYGAALLRRGYPSRALEQFTKAIEIEPDLVQAHANLAWTLLLLKRFDDAIFPALRALYLQPDLPIASVTLLLAKRSACDWSDLEQVEAKVLEHSAASPSTTDPLALMMLVDDPELQRRVARHNVPAVTSEGPALPAEQDMPSDRLRIAYMSADFREHPVGVSIVELLERHDRTHFELIGVMLGTGDGSDIEQRIRNAFEVYVDAGPVSDAVLIEQLRKLGIDILVDLMGHTVGARHNVLAAKPAQQTVGYLGYPGTTGLQSVDYLLADRNVIPDAMRRHYDEAVVWLPHSYFPTDTTGRKWSGTRTRDNVGLPETAFVFCAFCNSPKLSPGLFAAWMRILKRVEGAVLWMHSQSNSAKENLQREAAAQGVDPQRLVFAERVASRDEYLARFELADVFLDTWPYNAHSTARDALWAGVPVVTREGNGFASRVAGSLLRTMGLDDLIAPDLEGYEHSAVTLAIDGKRLDRVRERLASAITGSPLFKTQQLCRDVESAFLQIMERRWEGLGPSHFAVGDIGATS